MSADPRTITIALEGVDERLAGEIAGLAAEQPDRPLTLSELRALVAAGEAGARAAAAGDSGDAAGSAQDQAAALVGREVRAGAAVLRLPTIAARLLLDAVRAEPGLGGEERMLAEAYILAHGHDEDALRAVAAPASREALARVRDWALGLTCTVDELVAAVERLYRGAYPDADDADGAGAKEDGKKKTVTGPSSSMRCAPAPVERRGTGSTRSAKRTPCASGARRRGGGAPKNAPPCGGPVSTSARTPTVPTRARSGAGSLRSRASGLGAGLRPLTVAEVERWQAEPQLTVRELLEMQLAGEQIDRLTWPEAEALCAAIVALTWAGTGDDKGGSAVEHAHAKGVAGALVAAAPVAAHAAQCADHKHGDENDPEQDPAKGEND